MAMIMTKAALALKHVDSNVQVVKFEAHKPKKKTLSVNQTEFDNKHVDQKKELDLKKIRHEIVKFGMSGFDAKKKEEAKIALAVSLGAKPPKREYLNYKQLMVKRKEEKHKQNEEKQLRISKTKLTTMMGKKKKVNNDVGHFLSSYGKVQKKDLKKKETKSTGKKKKRTKQNSV